MKLFLSALILSVTLAFVPSLSHAATKADLAKVEAELAAKKQAQKDIAAQKADIAQKLKKLQKAVTEQNKALQAIEAERQQADLALAEITKRTQKQENSLTVQQEQLAQLVGSVYRLQKLPPQALLLKPGAPIASARTYAVLAAIVPNIAETAQTMQQELLQLAALREEMTAQQFATKQLQKQAEKERNALLAQLEERQKLLKSTTASAAKQNSQIAQLANRASDLRNLLTELVKPKTPVSTPKSWADSAVNLGRSVGLGKGKWPIVGQMAQAYGQKSQGGAQSDGVTIAADAGGIVSSPVAGTVRFAGPFRQYKLLVIIEHAGQYHSLLGGLGVLYTSVGQNVSAGEPIGKLATNRLYYEVRYRGQPTNPYRLIGG